MLELRDISASFGALRVLTDVDLAVGTSEIVAVLGASGSGKTTLLRVVAGLHRPDSGGVLWDGLDLGETPPHRRGFGMVFQDFALFPHLDVGENVAFGLEGRNRGRVAEELERVGLTGYERRKVTELSGGQAQRVALARALAPRPRLLLLDEPLGSLDRALRRELAGDLRAALRDAGIPAIHVTHDPDEAFAVADRIALLHEGQIIRFGPSERIWQAPGTEASARLLGLTTIVDVTVGRDGVSLGRGDGRPARAIVRQEAVRIAADGDLRGIVEDAIFRGPGYLLRVEVPGGEIAVAHHERVEPGQAVGLDIPQDAFTLLDG
ncbi:MAG TPA: ABC transporter ATP-binding protein [Acidimicrobiia bacterium]|nr:ABC transporter ATP-binding protein [Acidimicrobiia bacterium]